MRGIWHSWPPPRPQRWAPPAHQLRAAPALLLLLGCRLDAAAPMQPAAALLPPACSCPNLTNPLQGTASIEFCILPPDKGPCRAAVPSWFYDASAAACQPFLYGGCQVRRLEALPQRQQQTLMLPSACSVGCTQRHALFRSSPRLTLPSPA